MAVDLLDQIKANLQQHNVGIVEFCESSDYCNKRLYPRQKVLLKLIFLEELEGWEEDIVTFWLRGGRPNDHIVLSPRVREQTQYLRDNGFKHYREVELVGGRRSSKGYITGLAMTKILHETLQLQDPGRYYGIDPDKDIYFMCIAASEDQAKKYQFADLTAAATSCSALQGHIVRALETELRVATAADQRKLLELKKNNVKMQKDVARLRGTAEASNSGTIRGSTSMVVCIDEMAHMIPGESRASADEVYDAIEPSLDQFKGDGLMFLNSSPYTKVGKFFDKYQEALETVPSESEDEHSHFGEMMPADPMTLMMQFPSWALFDYYWQDPERRFRSAITVSADWDPDEKDETTGALVFSEDDRRGILVARRKEKTNPEKYKVERRGRFAEVQDAYLDPKAVDRMYLGRPHLDGTHEALSTNWSGSSYMYIYRAHLDPSSTTAGFGFALAHIEDLEEYVYDETGQRADNLITRPHVVFDIIKRWDPADNNGVIDWEVTAEETFRWIDIFRPRQVTFDQYQSKNLIQQLQKMVRVKGISGVEIFEKTATNEANWHRAESFKTALYMGLVHGPYDTADARLSSDELKFLVQINTAGLYPRVDKQTVGPVQTKDMADCIMEVVEALIGNTVASQNREELGTMPMAFGAPGGYGMSIEGETAQMVGNMSRHKDLAAWSPYYQQGGYKRMQSGLDREIVPYRGGHRRQPRTQRSAQRGGMRRDWGGAPIPRALPGYRR